MPAFSQPLMSLKIDDSYERLPIGFQLAGNPQTYSRIAAQICQGDAGREPGPSFSFLSIVSFHISGWAGFLPAHSMSLMSTRRIRLSHGESCWHSCWQLLRRSLRSSFWWLPIHWFIVWCVHDHFIIILSFYQCFVDCSRKAPERLHYLSRIIIMHISLWHTSARMNRDGKKELGAYRICREFFPIATHS